MVVVGVYETDAERRMAGGAGIGEVGDWTARVRAGGVL